MTEPVGDPQSYGGTLEKPVDDVLADARPLPAGDEMVIEGLTDAEERRFFEALRDA